jgi:UDP-N-acetylglucosamine 4,6-dehydratase
MIPLFKEQAKTGTVTITDSRMTRFLISLDEGIDLVIKALFESQGGEIYVRKIPSVKIVDVVEAIAPRVTIEMIGIRPGEKLHEQMIGSEESHLCLEFDENFIIYPNSLAVSDGQKLGGKTVPESFSYSSDSNHHWLNQEQLKQIIG